MHRKRCKKLRIIQSLYPTMTISIISIQSLELGEGSSFDCAAERPLSKLVTGVLESNEAMPRRVVHCDVTAMMVTSR